MLLQPDHIAIPAPDADLQRLKRLQRSYLLEMDSEDMQALISKAQEGDLIRYWIRGRYSTHNLIALCAQRLGKCDLYFSTWALSLPAVERIAAMQSSGMIERVICLLDYRTKTNAPDAVQLLEGIAERITYRRTHAKCYVLQNEHFGCAIISSSNLTTNRRTEGGVILFCKESATLDAQFIYGNSNSTNDRTDGSC